MYFFCSAVAETNDGIRRDEDFEDDNDPLYVHRPIFFTMYSKSKDIYVCFDHYNYNPTELAKIRSAPNTVSAAGQISANNNRSFI